jgi:hypothetical protein
MFIKMDFEEALARLTSEINPLPSWFNPEKSFVTYDKRWKFHDPKSGHFLLVGKDEEGKTHIKASR